ncbi:hypothetical protein HBI56_124610 [Parastagonospora nodorum]|nr:hypothetical protein HBH53_103800 [Parastagonospora nodorum]KAH3968830.1 hypothetical protein HBH51_127700 [Parastagonospora nodorum]KAH3997291.1 hypothetical protein HBI10_147790 [Parastagonospora nodorum]KAH4020007.1 hypothetical protein HBI13_120940 [Parastagonospora nodorum]KAH4026133.1 hypothetical protein HBI09_148810 [Parastagonospora nodorum]
MYVKCSVLLWFPPSHIQCKSTNNADFYAPSQCITIVPINRHILCPMCEIYPKYLQKKAPRPLQPLRCVATMHTFFCNMTPSQTALKRHRGEVRLLKPI